MHREGKQYAPSYGSGLDRGDRRSCATARGVLLGGWIYCHLPSAARVRTAFSALVVWYAGLALLCHGGRGSGIGFLREETV